jgi:hypothetical protein
MTEFTPYSPPEPKPEPSNMNRYGADTFLRGFFKSPNYSKGLKGWMIDEVGNAEFNDGVFRGDFTIGGLQKTIDHVSEIQPAIDELVEAGGGIIYLKDGEYVLTEDIVIPSGVTLSGVNRDGTIIDCNSAFGIKMQGSDAYNIGSVTMSTSATTVTGSGITEFVDTMIGQTILLGRNGYLGWYEITGVTDTATITIDPPYTGPHLEEQNYTIATAVYNPIVSRLTVTNATGAGITAQYAQEVNLDDIVVTGCGTGIDFDEVMFPKTFATISANGTNLDWFEVSGFKVDFTESSDATAGPGLRLQGVGNGTCIDSEFSSNSESGVKMINCSKIAYISVTMTANGRNGVEMESQCTDNKFTSLDIVSNTLSGVQLSTTSNTNIIYGCNLNGNGTYGVEVAASNFSTIVLGSQFAGNGTEAMIDSGTGTKIRSNIGKDDN